jgi:hypothetical protein
VTHLKLLSAGLLLLVAVSAVSTPYTPFFKIDKPMVCVKTAELTDQLSEFESMWAGVNLNEDTLKVDSIVEFYTSPSKQWIIIEHFPSREVSCTLGVGEGWEVNPKFTRKRGVTI